MILSVVIINRSLQNINSYINDINKYVDIEFIFVGSYSDYNLSGENIKFIDISTKNIKKDDLVDYINSENVVFLDNEILEIESLEIIKKEITNNDFDIILFRNSCNFNINPYIEYDNVILGGQDIFSIIIDNNMASINVYDFLENNFFIKILKVEFLKNIPFEYIYTILFDVSILIYAKYTKYVDKVVSNSKTNYYNSNLNIDIFKDINNNIFLNEYKKLKSNTKSFINIYMDSLYNYFVYRYIKNNELDKLNYLKSIIKENRDDFLFNLHIDNNKLYSRLSYSQKTKLRYSKYIHNIYYVMKDNKNNDIFTSIEENIISKNNESHILIFDSMQGYDFNRDIFTEVYDLETINESTKKYVFLYKLLGLKYMISDKENKHNIYIYSEDEVITYSIKENNNYTNDNIDDNDKYGNSKKIREFANYNDKCYSHMEPSLYTGRAISPDSIDSIYPTSIVFSSYRYDTVKSRITRPVFKIGPYINYCSDYIHSKLLNSIKDVFGKVLLVVPAHTTTNTDYENFDVNEYIDYIENIKSKYMYDTVLVCAYNNDIYKGLLKKYERRNWYIVTGGNIYGEFFYNRLKTIINLSDYTISNKLGTHVGCCLFLNKPHTIYQSDISLKRHPVEKKYEATLNELTINQKFEEMVFNKLLCEYNENITDKQYEIFSMYYGFDQIKTEEEIRFILEFSKKMYFSCIDEINDILEKDMDLLDRKVKIDNIYYNYVLNYLENNKNDTYYNLVFESMCDLENYIVHE